MAENIISDTGKSSIINKRVREDRKLVKEVDNVDFVIDGNEYNTFTNSRK